MRGAPHDGLSEFMRRINFRTSRLTEGRPRRREQDRSRQNSRKPARCQDTMVSGFTMIWALTQPGHNRRRPTQNARPRPPNRGCGCFTFEHDQ